MSIYEMEEEMEEPTPCACGRIVELQQMGKCQRCRELFCRQCLKERVCVRCRGVRR